VQIIQIWTAHVSIGIEPTSAQIGGSARCYQAIFVPSTASPVPATTVNQPYIYTSPRLR
jgi:hypothetical protein